MIIQLAFYSFTNNRKFHRQFLSSKHAIDSVQTMATVSSLRHENWSFYIFQNWFLAACEVNRHKDYEWCAV